MDGNLSLILAFLVSISVVLALVIKFKLHPFLSLFIGCLLMGVCSGLDPMAIIKTSCKGFGDTMGDIGIIILLGVAMGQILHESGCTREIANTMLRLCGREKSALALNLTGYIISIPVFFDAAFVILIGLIREMAREGKLALNTLVTALVVGLTCTHALVIPTPGPVAVAGNMGADIGWFIVYGALIALPASLIGGVLYGKYLGRKFPIFLTDEEPDAALVEQALAKSAHPSGALGIAIIFLPIVLIFFANILNAFRPRPPAASSPSSATPTSCCLSPCSWRISPCASTCPSLSTPWFRAAPNPWAPSSPSSARAARSGPSSARAASAPPSSTSCRAGASRSSCSASS